MNITPVQSYGYSSDSDNEKKRDASSPRAEASSSYQPSTRIPDRNRRVRFNVPTEPTLLRSSGGREPEPIMVYTLEQDLDKAKLNINKAAAELVKLNETYPSVVKDCLKKGMLPAVIGKKYNIDLPVDIQDVIRRYHNTLANK